MITEIQNYWGYIPAFGWAILFSCQVLDSSNTDPVDHRSSIASLPGNSPETSMTGSVRDQASHLRKQQTARPHSVHWWLSHQRPVRMRLHCQARYDHLHEDSAAYTVSTSSLTMEMEAFTHALRWIASRGGSRTTSCHHPHRFSELATKSEKWNGKPRQECVNGRHPPSKPPVGVLAALDMPEWRETTEQIDWRAKQPSQVACFSEDLKCWWA